MTWLVSRDAGYVTGQTIGVTVASGSADQPGRMACRRALATGGASGIGLATVRRLAAEAARVVAVDQRPPPAGGPSVPYLTADVTRPDQVAATVNRAAALLGGPADVLVNAAGIYRIRPLLELTPAEWDETLAVNLRGPFLAGRAVAAALIDVGGPGAIVNIASTAALVADGASRPPTTTRARPAGARADPADGGRVGPAPYPGQRRVPGCYRHADAAADG